MDELLSKMNTRRETSGRSQILWTQRMDHVIGKYNLTRDSVPAKGAAYRLSEEMKLVPPIAKSLPVESVAKPYEELVKDVHKVTGLRWFGIDLICDDVQNPETASSGYICEVNSAPSRTDLHRVWIGKPTFLQPAMS